MIDSKQSLAVQLGFEEPPAETPQETIIEAGFNTEEVINLAKTSLDFLAALALPAVFRYFFPDVFQQIWKFLLSYVHKVRDFSQLAIGLPRGFAKTTFIKIFVLYVILFTSRKFILICAHSVPKAVAIVSDICDFLNELNIKQVFGDWNLGKEVDQQVLKKFGFRGRTIIIAAATVDTVRGLNIKHERPDIMIFDDIQSRQDADSDVVSAQIETDMMGTAMKAKSPHGCLFIFIGNMYPTKWSILRRLKENPTWIKFIAGGIIVNSKGQPESLWEDLQPLDQLLKEYENDLASGRPEVFYAEVLNDENASVNLLIDVSRIPQCPFEEEIISRGLHQGNFIVIDPSNDKANSDNVSLGYFEIWDGKPVCVEVVEGRLSPGESIEESLKLCFKYNCSVVGVESNAYQYSYLYWSNYICAQKGIIGINFVEVYSGKRSKNSRILDMFKQLIAAKPEIYITLATRPAILSQITSFNPLKTNNVDGLLDLLAYAPKMIELYGEFIASQVTITLQEANEVPLLEAFETSPF